jgi:hypothetical protein
MVGVLPLQELMRRPPQGEPQHATDRFDPGFVARIWGSAATTAALGSGFSLRRF